MRHRRQLGVALATIALVLAGCGGGDESGPPDTVDARSDNDPVTSAPTSAATTATAPTGGATASASEVDPLDGLAFEVDQTFWHSGFAVTIDGGAVKAESAAIGEVVRHTLVLSGTAENLGTESTSFFPEMAIQQGGTTIAPAPSSESGSVGGGLTGELELAFALDDGFDPEQAVLLIGSGDQARAEVPLQPAAGTLVDLPPQEVDVTGTLSVELVDLTITGAELRWDIPATHDQVAPGERALTLTLDATSRKPGNWQLFPTEIFLTTPAGTSVPVDGAELGSLPGTDAGVVTTDRYVRFRVDEEAAGDYTLEFQPASYWVEAGPTTASLDFTLE